MSVRTLDILDLPLLLRSHDDVLPLDGARFYTRGTPLGASALLAYWNPLRHLYTAVSSENGSTLMGQMTLESGETSARMTFLTPGEGLNGLTLPLLDHLAEQAGRWGAYHLLAELDEDSPVFKTLRQACFAVYATQRVWKLPEFRQPAEKNSWREARPADWIHVQSLHGQIVPTLIQPVDTLPRYVAGLVCHDDDTLLGYASISRGPRGVWLRPLIPPDSNCLPGHAWGLVKLAAGGGNRPVYLCVRSYQAWLESALEDMGARPGPATD